MRIKVYFGTNRNPIAGDDGQITGFGDELGPIGGVSVRFGTVEVDIDLAKQTRVVDTATFKVEPETLQGTQLKFGSQAILSSLHADMLGNKRDTLVYIHGFWNSFLNGIENAAEIAAFYGNNMNVFAFSWPATDATLPVPIATYAHDRKTAAASGTAMARTILILEDFLEKLGKSQWCQQNLHLLCHSMGNYAMRGCVQELQRLRDGGVGRLFDNIILAAADEDVDVFDNPEKMESLPQMGNRVVVYYTPRDIALNDLSRFTKLNGDRLGSSGPDNMMPISDKVAAVDVSEKLHLDNDLTNHQYYRINPAVRDDIVQVLGGKPNHAILGRRPTGMGRYAL